MKKNCQQNHFLKKFEMIINDSDCLTDLHLSQSACHSELKVIQACYKSFIGKEITALVNQTFSQFADEVKKFRTISEEEEFYLFIVFSAVQSILAVYANINQDGIDRDRCLIDLIEKKEEGIYIKGILLPPLAYPMSPAGPCQ